MFTKAMGYFYKHWVMHKKDHAEKGWIFLYPLVSLFSIGLLAKYLGAAGAPENVVPFVLIGVISWDIYSLCQKAVVYGMQFDLWDFCFKHSAATPAGVKDFVLGNSMFGVASSMVSLAFITVISSIFFQFNIFSAGIVAVLALLVIFLFAIAAGLAIDSVIMMYGKEYIALVWSTPGLIMLLSGVYYPVSMLPGIARDLSFMLPTTHAINAMRIAFGFSAGTASGALLAGFAISLIYLALFFWTLDKSILHSKRAGGTILS